MDHQLYTPALRANKLQENHYDYRKESITLKPAHHETNHNIQRNQSQPTLNQITFDNVIKKPNFEKVVQVNHSKLFSYDENRLFGHNKGAMIQSAFSTLIPELILNGAKHNMLPIPRASYFTNIQDRQHGQNLQVGIGPSEQWKHNRELEQEFINPSNPIRQISLFDPSYELSREQICIERMSTVNKLQLYEKVSDNKYEKEESSERYVTLSSDNYFGALNCILHCLLKVLPLKSILRKFTMNQIDKNDGSNYEGVVSEQISAFFTTYTQSKRKSCMSPVKVMRLLELMNPQYKSFFKRDPFDMFLALINGLHQDLNIAPKRNQISPANSYPAFENQGLVELDYIQAEKWHKFFTELDNSPIMNMFQGRILKQIQCQSCFTPKLIFENFLSLTLNLKNYPKSETINLQELIVQYFQFIQDSSSVSSTDNITQFYCLKCRKNTPYKKEVSVWRFPKFLTLQIQRFESFVNKVNSYQHNLFFPVDSLDLRKFATVSKDESVKVAVYNLIGVVSLAGFINANKFQVHVLNQKEKRWYLYEEDEKVSQSGVESPSRHAYMLLYQRIDALTHQYE